MPNHTHPRLFNIKRPYLNQPLDNDLCQAR